MNIKNNPYYSRYGNPVKKVYDKSGGCYALDCSNCREYLIPVKMESKIGGLVNIPDTYLFGSSLITREIINDKLARAEQIAESFIDTCNAQEGEVSVRYIPELLERQKTKEGTITEQEKKEKEKKEQQKKEKKEIKLKDKEIQKIVDKIKQKEIELAEADEKRKKEIEEQLEKLEEEKEKLEKEKADIEELTKDKEKLEKEIEPDLLKKFNALNYNKLLIETLPRVITRIDNKATKEKITTQDDYLGQFKLLQDTLKQEPPYTMANLTIDQADAIINRVIDYNKLLMNYINDVKRKLKPKQIENIETFIIMTDYAPDYKKEGGIVISQSFDGRGPITDLKKYNVISEIPIVKIVSSGSVPKDAAEKRLTGGFLGRTFADMIRAYKDVGKAILKGDIKAVGKAYIDNLKRQPQTLIDIAKDLPSMTTKALSGDVLGLVKGEIEKATAPFTEGGLLLGGSFKKRDIKKHINLLKELSSNLSKIPKLKKINGGSLLGRTLGDMFSTYKDLGKALITGRIQDIPKIWVEEVKKVPRSLIAAVKDLPSDLSKAASLDVLGLAKDELGRAIEHAKMSASGFSGGSSVNMLNDIINLFDQSNLFKDDVLENISKIDYKKYNSLEGLVDVIQSKIKDKTQKQIANEILKNLKIKKGGQIDIAELEKTTGIQYVPPKRISKWCVRKGKEINRKMKSAILNNPTINMDELEEQIKANVLNIKS
jgi:hypothetical protein